MQRFTYIPLLLAVLLPFSVSAQTDFKSTVGSVTSFVESLIPLLTAVAILVFFWGLADYVFAASSDEKEGGKQRLTWGVVGLFVITTIWAIVTFLTSSIAIT